MSNLHNAPDGREPLNLANRQPDAAATPFLQAVHRYRADMLEARRLSATDDGDDVLSEAEDRFHASTEAALPFRHLSDALAAVEWVRADLAESSADHPDDPNCPADVAHRHLLLTGAANLLREVQEAGATAFSTQPQGTTEIPELGMTFGEAAMMNRTLRQAERDASQRGDQDAVDAASIEHGRLSFAVMDSEPRTAGDAMVILGMLADPELGVESGIPEDIAQRALERVFSVLSVTALSEPAHSEMSDAFRRFMDLRESLNHLPENREPNQEELTEEDRLFSIITDHPASNATDALAQLALCLLVYMGDSIFDLEDEESGYARALRQGLAYFARVGDPSMRKLFANAPTSEREGRAFWARVEPAECVEAEGARLEDEEAPEEDKRLATDSAESGLSNDDTRLMGLFKTLDPNGKEAMVSIGQAMVTLGDAMDMARKAIALDQHWAGFFAKLLKEDAAKIDPQNDADLLDLWSQYLPIKAEAERLLGNADDEEWERAHAPCEKLEDRMAAIPARTATGLAVKLAVLWQWGGANVGGPGERDNERRDGPNSMSDFMVRWLWMVMNEARALGVPMPLIPDDATADSRMAAALSRGLALHSESDHPIAPPVNGNDMTADPFADTVAAFQDEAPATLAIPQQPTGGMVEAGASAAGITPQQFQAAYAAAMAAFQQERAA